VEISRNEIEKMNIGNKTTAFHFDAVNLNKLEKHYDLIITTWFTAGNFFPDDFPFDNYKNSENRRDLSVNEKFSSIFKNAYSLLNDGGEILIGSCYIDNNETRLKQEEAYLKMGMTVITDEADSFTATKEKFWSQRFTREKLYNYLHFVDRSKISFTPLDTYNYSMQVRIRK
jgi:hypothetical protein